MIPEIIYKNRLDVRRLGIVYTYKLSQEELEKYIKKYIKPEIKGVCNVRFSKKETTALGDGIAGNSDYYNKIFTIGSIADNQIGISYDYQLHFSPLREYVNDLVGKFISDGYNAFQKDLSFEV